MLSFNLFYVFIITSLFHRQVSTGFNDYVNTITSYFTAEAPDTSVGDFPQRIPYEVSTADEKFISEAAKLTGVALSELDSCQQRVVLKLKSDCDKMNDEQLAKMAVHLLNCQSYVEGRLTFPCTEDMSIRDCTRTMDSDTWTSYHLMSNRARAVCYSIRQIQFRGLAEHTVNKLMQTASHQLKTLAKIAESQRSLQEMAESTLGSVAEGYALLSNQQRDIQQAQFHGQLVLEDNIRRLAKEKELIAESHDHLVQLTLKIQGKLEESSKDLEDQVGESRKNHMELLGDLDDIQTKAQGIFERIEASSTLLLEQNENFKLQYEETLRNLAEVNRTVHNLVTLVGGTRQALEERLAWLTTALGGTDLAVERLYLILWHCAFMLASMLTCAFLSARFSTRVMVATLPPLNLGLALYGCDKQVGPLNLGIAIVSLVLAQTILSWAVSLRPKILHALSWQPLVDKSNPPEKTATDDRDYVDFNYFDEEIDDNFDMNGLGSPTPPLSRSSVYSSRTRSRSKTPLLINGSSRGVCRAKTRVGTPCKLSSLPGRDFCFRHQTGDSVIVS